MQIYKSESNTVNGVVANGYMPQLSTTIKSLAISGTGTEVFDLGESWQIIDNIVVNLVNCVDSATSSVTVAFADSGVLLNNTTGSPAGTMAGLAPNATSRLVSSAGLSGCTFTIKVVARYIRIRIANGTVSAQPATAYIDIKGYALTP
jgi:hypothetical protein